MLKNIVIFKLLFMLCVSCGQKIEESKKPTKSFGTPDSNSGKEKSPLEANREALELAIASDDTNLIPSTLDKLSDLNFHFKSGETPLTHAILNAKEEIVMLLLSHTGNIDINLKNKDGNAPIHLAIKKQNQKLLLKIISTGADLELKNAEKSTPLIYSLQKENLNERISIILVTKGANIHANASNGKTVYQIARAYNLRGLMQLMDLINAHKLATNQNLNNAILSANIDFVDYLLYNFRSYRQLLQHRNLIVTAMKIQEEDLKIAMIQKLISAGSDINNEEGIPPLINAVILADHVVVNLLLGHGANPLMTDDSGFTALDYAAEKLLVDIMHSLVNAIEHKKDDFSFEVIQASVIKACENLPTVEEMLNIEGANTSTKIAISDLLNCNQRY